MPAGGDDTMLNNLNVDSKQFGMKIGKHAEDYGLDPSNPAHREQMRHIINDTIGNYTEMRRGTWPGQNGEVTFYIRGNDVVIANGMNFVSILKDGVTNAKVMRARRT